MAKNESAAEIKDPSVDAAGASQGDDAQKPRRGRAARPKTEGVAPVAEQPAMVIRCFHERQGGSDIDIDGIIYRFRPNAKGHHVAEVRNPKHISRLLSIGDSYVNYAVPEDQQRPSEPGGSRPAREREATGQVAIVDEIVGDDEGIPYDQWNDQDLIAEVMGQFNLKEANTFVMARLGKDLYDLDLNPNDAPRGIAIALLEAYDANGPAEEE